MSRNISVESAKTYFGCLNYFSDIRSIVRTCELLTLAHVRNMIETSRVHRLDSKRIRQIRSLFIEVAKSFFA